jgi:7-cyano-7-deazaguanine synthase
MKCVVVFSGGLDSTVLLWKMWKLTGQVAALSVDYGQRHRKELVYAKRMSEKLDIPHEVADLRAIRDLIGGSSQTDDSIPVPEGHYAAENMKLTVVPNRNMILLSVAIGWAIQRKAEVVAYAAHGGDHAIYPDCRPEFVDIMAKAAQVADWRAVFLDAPFLLKTKAEVVKIGAELGVPFVETWSCYKGGDRHCGKCGTCVERIEAFEKAGVPDPTEYA